MEANKVAGRCVHEAARSTESNGPNAKRVSLPQVHTMYDSSRSQDEVCVPHLLSRTSEGLMIPEIFFECVREPV